MVLGEGGGGMSVPENGLLDEQDVAASLLNLFDQVKDVGTLLAQHAVHLGIV